MSFALALTGAFAALCFLFAFYSSKLSANEWLNKLFFSLSLTSAYGLMYSVSVLAQGAALIADLGAPNALALQNTLEAAGVATMLVTLFFWTLFFIEAMQHIFSALMNPYSDKEQEDHIGIKG